MTNTIDKRTFADGGFFVWRKNSRPPRYRHPTYQAAEAEAVRLAGLNPKASFVIMQAVARVKTAADPDAATGCADDQTFAATDAETLRCAAGMPEVA